METIRALIVDDEPIARRGLRQNLQRESDVEIVGECANGREAIAAIKELSPDLVFLDVQMPLLDGFGVIESLGAEATPAVVFVTAYDEHAIRAFEVNALDYLLKPIDPERFRKTLARARGQIVNSHSKQLEQKFAALLRSLDEFKASGATPASLERIAIKEQGRVFFLSVNEIDWLCAQGNYVRLHAKGETHLLRETMDGMERKLDPRHFLRLRRSTIVRIERIKELHPLFNGEYAIVLKDGTQLISSRRYRKNLDAFGPTQSQLRRSFDRALARAQCSRMLGTFSDRVGWPSFQTTESHALEQQLRSNAESFYRSLVAPTVDERKRLESLRVHYEGQVPLTLVQ